MSNDPLDVFLHIPKTAGTSFNTFLTRVYGKQHVFHTPARDFDVGAEYLTGLPLETQSNIRLVRGHIAHGLHDHVDRRVRYFTILREPKSRIRSFLDHMASEAALVPHDESPWYVAVREWTDFETYVERRPRQVDNYMVRALSGIDFPAGTCSDDILEIAIHNLDNMPAFGIQEQLAESILILRIAMAWRVLPVFSRAKSGNPKRIAISDRDLNTIEELNRFDRALYNHACTRFSERLDTAIRLKAGMLRGMVPIVSRAEKIVRTVTGAGR